MQRKRWHCDAAVRLLSPLASLLEIACKVKQGFVVLQRGRGTEAETGAGKAGHAGSQSEADAAQGKLLLVDPHDMLYVGHPQYCLSYLT